jgi:dolichol-phosphate mannosyltransferase
MPQLPQTQSIIKPVYSIVAPIYNESGNIPELYKQISTVMDSTGEPWELITVNDGSRDNSLQLLREIGASNPHVKVIDFARNFGHQIAVTAGMDFTIGDAVVVIDADLQDPPRVILDLIAK